LARPGAEGDEYSLAPHYDLLSTSIYQPSGRWGDADPAWPMGEATRAADVTRAGVLGFAAAIGLPRAQAEREVAARVARVMAEAAAMLEALPDSLAEGDRRVLRMIVFGVIKDMAGQLRGPARRTAAE
jgi:serine/threonine-protein kinase HipA